jgi:hypothetical protein
MSHQNILKSKDVGSSNLSPIITTQLLNFLKQNGPDSLWVEYVSILRGLIFEHQFGCEVSYILKHTNSSEIVIDVLPIVRGILVDGLQDCDEVFLTQLIYIVANNEFQASKASCHNLFTIKFGSLANCDYHNSPTIILKLLPTSLYNFLNTFQGLEFVALVLRFQLIREWG